MAINLLFVLIYSQSNQKLLEPVDWKSVPNLKLKAIEKTIPTFLNSCSFLSKKNKYDKYNIHNIWETTCEKIENNRSLFFEELKPVLIKAHDKGLMTGYFEIKVDASYKKKKDSYPIYSYPDNIIKVELEEFDSKLTNIQIFGEVRNNILFPLPNRKKINNGYYKNKKLEIAWIDNYIDAYFLHIQGSGILSFPDGKEVKVGYAGSNNYKYTSIGGILIKKGLIPKAKMSMFAIKKWLKNNPDLAKDLLEKNDRYIFFKQKNNGPIGSSGLTLTPNISVAVDSNFIPLGSLLLAQSTNNKKWYKLLVAQDTGAAIKGPKRIDFFLGEGKEAEKVASSLSENIKLWIILPNKIVSLINQKKIDDLTFNKY